MADTEGTPDFHLAAYVTNLGKYNEGYLVGEWVKFPVTCLLYTSIPVCNRKCHYWN